jgi:hypothetical protein
VLAHRWRLLRSFVELLATVSDGRKSRFLAKISSSSHGVAIYRIKVNVAWSLGDLRPQEWQRYN